MATQLPIQRCQYCGSEDIGLGWQHGEALVTFKKHGLLGNRLQYLICRHCCRTLPVRSRASQVSRRKIGAQKLRLKTKRRLWG